MAKWLGDERRSVPRARKCRQARMAWMCRSRSDRLLIVRQFGCLLRFLYLPIGVRGRWLDGTCCLGVFHCLLQLKISSISFGLQNNLMKTRLNSFWFLLELTFASFCWAWTTFWASPRKTCWADSLFWCAMRASASFSFTIFWANKTSSLAAFTYCCAKYTSWAACLAAATRWLRSCAEGANRLDLEKQYFKKLLQK